MSLEEAALGRETPWDALRDALPGVGVALVTPLARGSVAHDAIAAHVEYLIEREVGLLVPGWDVSEWQSLTAAESRAALETVCSAAAGRCAIAAGIGGSLKEALAAGEAAQAAGAWGVILPPPPHGYGSREGLRRYYGSLAESLELGIVLARQDGAPDDDLLLELAAHPRIVGVIVQETDPVRLRALIERAADTGVVWLCSGGEQRVLFSYMAGARGLVSRLANFAPERVLAYFRALSRSDLPAALALGAELAPFERLGAGEGPGRLVPAIKEALSQLGLPVGPEVRLPLLPLDDDERGRVRTLLQRLSLL